jgi:hypothetical protein
MHTFWEEKLVWQALCQYTACAPWSATGHAGNKLVTSMAGSMHLH